jgi:uncharacterized protein
MGAKLTESRLLLLRASTSLAAPDRRRLVAIPRLEPFGSGVTFLRKFNSLLSSGEGRRVGSGAPSMVTAQDITFPSAGLELVGTLFEPDGADQASAILFVHGLHSDQGGYRERAEAVSQRLRAVSLTFDLGGHGRSAGSLAELTARTHLADVLAAYDLLVSQPSVDAERIGICGASYGAYLTALVTADRPVRRLLLRAPALFADEDLDTPVERRTAALDGGPSVALVRLARYEGEVLIVESALDEVISAATIDAYRAACPRAAHEVIPDTGHELVGAARATFRELIVSWFAGL